MAITGATTSPERREKMPKLDHINIHTRDGKAMVAFFEQVLGAREGPRPPFDFPGHWVYVDGEPLIHLTVVKRDADFPKGLIDHIAFGIYDDAEAAMARAEASGYPLELRSIPETNIGQIFIVGPEGIKIEVQYRLA